MLTQKWNDEELTLEDVKGWLREQTETERLNDEEEFEHVATCLYHIYRHDRENYYVGKFLRYILKNDFMGVAGMADHINSKVLSVYAKFLYNIAPGNVVEF